MMRDRRQIAVLVRIGRMAKMWRQQALHELADALGEEGRAVDLEKRSRALTTGYAQIDAATGATLTDRARMTAQLTRLIRHAEGFREAASRRSETARILLSRASERVDDLDKRVSQARQQLAQRHERRQQSLHHNLARNLLDDTVKAKGGKR